MRNFWLIGLMTTVLVSCSTNKNISRSDTGMRYDIERIEYFTSACFGICPQFKIEIDKDRKAVYTAIRFNFSQDFEALSPEGTFKAVIHERDYDLLLKKLNDIDFPTLQDDYKVGYTDAQTANLKIFYNNGQIKSMKDYGMRGTPELEEIYQWFSDLRKNQDWEKIK